MAEYEDFVPKIIEKNEVTKTTITESLSTILERAKRWIADQKNIEIINLQTVQYRLGKHTGLLKCVTYIYKCKLGRY